jgi:hypothetical protein
MYHFFHFQKPEQVHVCVRGVQVRVTSPWSKTLARVLDKKAELSLGNLTSRGCQHEACKGFVCAEYFPRCFYVDSTTQASVLPCSPSGSLHQRFCRQNFCIATVQVTHACPKIAINLSSWFLSHLHSHLVPSWQLISRSQQGSFVFETCKETCEQCYSTCATDERLVSLRHLSAKQGGRYIN